MQLRELNIGDKFSIDRDESHPELFGYNADYLVINPNSDNFKITHHGEYFNLDNYCFVLNLDTFTLGILLKTQKVELND